MLLKMAAAPVAIVAGHTASQYYEKYLRRNEVRHETIWLTGVKGSDSEI
jgi:Tfp pilus assembly major pilin PilA